MNNFALLFFSIAWLNVTFGRITFDCEKYKIRAYGSDVIEACVNNHLKDFFGKMEHNSDEYQCWDYAVILCMNKIKVVCENSKSEEQLYSPTCPAANTMKCAIIGPNDFGKVDSKKKKNKKKGDSRLSKSGESPSANKKTQPSETQSSSTVFRLELPLIFALLFAYFV